MSQDVYEEFFIKYKKYLFHLGELKSDENRFCVGNTDMEEFP